MNDINPKIILSTIKKYSNIKLIGYIDGKEEIIELDEFSKLMLIGYFSKKKSLIKEQ